MTDRAEGDGGGRAAGGRRTVIGGTMALRGRLADVRAPRWRRRRAPRLGPTPRPRRSDDDDGTADQGPGDVPVGTGTSPTMGWSPGTTTARSTRAPATSRSVTTTAMTVTTMPTTSEHGDDDNSGSEREQRSRAASMTTPGTASDD